MSNVFVKKIVLHFFFVELLWTRAPCASFWLCLLARGRTAASLAGAARPHEAFFPCGGFLHVEGVGAPTHLPAPTPTHPFGHCPLHRHTERCDAVAGSGWGNCLANALPFHCKTALAAREAVRKQLPLRQAVAPAASSCPCGKQRQAVKPLPICVSPWSRKSCIGRPAFPPDAHSGTRAAPSEPPRGSRSISVSTSPGKC